MACSRSPRCLTSCGSKLLHSLRCSYANQRLHHRHISTYLTAFFNLPVKRSTGEELTHEQVVNLLDDETVSYDATLGFNGLFSDLLRISIKVETGRYEAAVAWLRDLIYGARFDRERLSVAVAKIQQNLPELKRDGSTVLSAVSTAQLYGPKCTSRAGTVLEQMEFIPKIAKRLQDEPEAVIAEFETIRSHRQPTRFHRRSVLLILGQ
jgi:Zn-dependent M16 (insulinase) family peptidase